MLPYVLQNILDYEGDVEQDMFMSFQVSVGEYGKIKTVDLKVELTVLRLSTSR